MSQQLFPWFRKCTHARYYYQGMILSESLPGYVPKLEFKYCEIQFLRVTAIVLIPEMYG